uniref:Uncharacterized protein n=1 Tax=Arundo donax TaxID=35708 RepID=A0A0A9ESD6_ARUDO
MTPRAPPLRHHSLHLLLAEAVASWHPFQKKPCLSDRSTAPASFAHLPDAETPTPAPSGGGSGGSFRWLGLRKRRRRGVGSRSVSGRSSDRRRSGTCSDSTSLAALVAAAPLTPAGRFGRRMWGRCG